ncbi:MAG TPA: hypothetical protein DCL44_01555 [Elusimicrobia bacterium]|nr:hypothetical protein [Elusimicrobiota bacterium]
MKVFILTAALAGLGATAHGEIITLKDGTKIEGEITGELDNTSLVKTKYGSLTINNKDILERTPDAVAVSSASDIPAETAISSRSVVSLSNQPPAPAKFTFKTVKPDTSTVQTLYYEDSVVIATETFPAAGAPPTIEGTVKDGSYREYYDTGALKTIKDMAGGKVAGILKAFFPNGTIQTEAQYSNGILDGPVTIRGENGILQFDQSFKNGTPDGWFRQYDSQGNVKSETLYSDGRVVENPQPVEQKIELKKEPVKEPENESVVVAKAQRLARGERFSFYLNNKYIARVYLDKDLNIIGRDGKAPDGAVKVYSKDDKLEKEFVFENNEVTILRVYDPGGELKAEYGYKEDKAIKK